MKTKTETYNTSQITTRGKNTALSAEDKAYITENRMELSMIDMAAHLEIPLGRVQRYMDAHNLGLTKKEIQHLIRLKKGITTPVENSDDSRNYKRQNYQRPAHVPDFWNHSLNPITMLTCAKATEAGKVLYDYVVLK